MLLTAGYHREKTARKRSPKGGGESFYCLGAREREGRGRGGIAAVYLHPGAKGVLARIDERYMTTSEQHKRHFCFSSSEKKCISRSLLLRNETSDRFEECQALQ